MEKEKELQLLDLNIFVSILFILSISLSIFLSIENKKNIQNRSTLFSKKDDQHLDLFNRLLALTLFLIIVYINYTSYKIKPSLSSKHQLWASVLAFISTIIVLYSVLEGGDRLNIENPTL